MIARLLHDARDFFLHRQVCEGQGDAEPINRSFVHLACAFVIFGRVDRREDAEIRMDFQNLSGHWNIQYSGIHHLMKHSQYCGASEVKLIEE